MFYYFLPVILCIIGFILIKENIYKRIFLLVISFYVFFIIGFKGEVDSDYASYEFLLYNAPTFKEGLAGINKFSQDYGFEFGLTLLNVTLKSLSLKLYWFYSIIAFVSVYCIYKVSIKNSVQSCFLTFLFIYITSFIGLWIQVRFGLATLASMMSFFLFFEGKKKLSYFFIILAFLFHNIVFSAAIPLIVYLLFNRVGFNKIKIIIFLVFSSFFVFIDFSSILNTVLVLFASRYEAYSFEEAGNISSYFIRLGFFIVMLLLAKGRLSDFREVDRFLISMVFSSVIIFILATQVTILYRLGVFFELGYIVFLKRSSYISRTNYFFGLCVMFVMLGYRAVSLENEILPYYSVLLSVSY